MCAEMIPVTANEALQQTTNPVTSKRKYDGVIATDISMFFIPFSSAFSPCLEHSLQRSGKGPQ